MIAPKGRSTAMQKNIELKVVVLMAEEMLKATHLLTEEAVAVTIITALVAYEDLLAR